MEIIKLYDLTKKLLQEKEELRGNDDLLYLTVIKIVHPYWNNGITTTNVENMTIGEFFTCRKTIDIPTFESVTRCRRKVQEENPDLKPCKKIQEARRMQEEKFYDFSKLKQQSFDF